MKSPLITLISQNCDKVYYAKHLFHLVSKYPRGRQKMFGLFGHRTLAIKRNDLSLH